MALDASNRAFTAHKQGHIHEPTAPHIFPIQPVRTPDEADAQTKT